MHPLEYLNKSRVAKPQETDYVAYLVSRKFSGLWPPIPFGLLHRPYGGIVRGDDEWVPPTEAYKQKAEKYRKKLSAFQKSKLKKLYNEELIRQRSEDEQNRFFNQPHADADFEYWAKMDHWSLDEALALSFGKNPKIVTWEQLKEIPSYTSPFVLEYERTKELVWRAVTWKKLYQFVTPSIFLNWARENDLTFPDELASIIEARTGKLLDWKKMYNELLEESHNNLVIANQVIAAKNEKIQGLESTKTEDKPLHTKERESLLKLVIGMATDGYGYDQSASRSPIPKEIADQLAGKGIPIHQDTVRNWLKEASEFLPLEGD